MPDLFFGRPGLEGGSFGLALLHILLIGRQHDGGGHACHKGIAAVEGQGVGDAVGQFQAEMVAAPVLVALEPVLLATALEPFVFVIF